MIQNLNEELFSFIKKSPTGFHAVHELANYLTEAGFERLAEGNTWNLAEGGKYFVTRNQSAIIAFKVSRKDYSGFHIAASHSDSPTLKIKESSEMNIENQYVKLNVEKYGGMLCAPWFDRPLSVAGRIIVKDGNRLTTKLINVDRDLLMIPNLAIHMNREVNDGYKYNIQKDMLPLYRMSNSGKAFKEMIAEEAGVSVDQIKGMDLFLYNRMEGTVWGCDKINLGSFGDTNPHLHFHIVPKYEGGFEFGGSFAITNPEPVLLSEGEYQEMIAALREKLGM